MPRAKVSAAIAAQNTFTDSVTLPWQSWFNVSVSGTFSATVWLQRSFDAGVTWLDVESYTAATEEVILNAETDVQWRIGVKTGGYTSGTAVCRLSQ